MTDLEQLQILAQLVNSMEMASLKLEKTYNEKDLENFNESKQVILNIQKRISQILKQSLLEKKGSLNLFNEEGNKFNYDIIEEKGFTQK